MRTFAQAARVLGALEERLMEVAWSVNVPMAVREVAARLGDTHAYTTVMTTLDRLYKKGLLARELDGNAYRYWPALSRDDYHRRVVEETVSGLIERSAGPVVSAFVDLAVSLDSDNLARIERAIAKYKKKSAR
jgi:BlaI family transcriptional regulator, penicillinase repressor